MVNLTFVVTKKISKKDFEKFMKGDHKVGIVKEVEWSDYQVSADTGNFDGVVLDLSGGEMLFVSNDHPWVKKLLEEDSISYRHIRFPELDG